MFLTRKSQKAKTMNSFVRFVSEMQPAVLSLLWTRIRDFAGHPAVLRAQGREVACHHQHVHLSHTQSRRSSSSLEVKYGAKYLSECLFRHMFPTKIFFSTASFCPLFSSPSEVETPVEGVLVDRDRGVELCVLLCSMQYEELS